MATGPRRHLPASPCRPGEARPLAERALAIAEATYGPGHPTVVWLRANPAAIEADLKAGGAGDGTR
jgi:hypothetical protein